MEMVFSFSKLMCTGSALSNNLTSFACVAQRLTGTSFKDSYSSEEFKSELVSSKESKRFRVWSEGREIKKHLSHYNLQWH